MPYLRLAILIWLTAWTLVVPLVHVHPEADHHHGQTSHFHGGTLHSIFSSDLPCEYQAGPQADAPYTASKSKHKFEHPEIGFSLLTSSEKQGSGKPVLDNAIFVGILSLLVHPECTFIHPSSAESAISVVLPFCLSSRAPPVAA